MNRILCVEDDPRIAELICRKLERIGYVLLHASNAESATTLVAKEGPDLILLDIGLGEVRDSGWRFYRHLRDNRDTSHIPVIAITGQEIGWDRAKCVREGFADYIRKPIDFQHLYKALMDNLKKAGKTP